VNRPEKSDSEFSWKDFVDKNNNELLANLGNLVNRVLLYIQNNHNGAIPPYDHALETDADVEFIAEIESRYQRYCELLNRVEIKEGLKFSMEVSSRGNKYLQDTKFFDKTPRYSFPYQEPRSS
jgi:methionyl-tRNA synthetase